MTKVLKIKTTPPQTKKIERKEKQKKKTHTHIFSKFFYPILKATDVGVHPHPLDVQMSFLVWSWYKSQMGLFAESPLKKELMSPFPPLPL